MATDIIYPASLPRFLAAGHTRSMVSAVRRFAMEVGTARVRRCFSTPPQMVDVSTELTQTQLDTLHTFYEQVLDVGTLSFYVEIAGTSSEGSGIELWEAIFLAPLLKTVQHGSHRYKVSAKLLIFGESFYVPVAPFTWDPIDRDPAQVLSADKLTTRITEINLFSEPRGVRGNLYIGTGKRYFEVYTDVGGSGAEYEYLGVASAAWVAGSNTLFTDGLAGWGVQHDGSVHHNQLVTPGGLFHPKPGGIGNPRFSDGLTHVFMVAIDFNTGHIWFGTDGLWYGTDPATDLYPVFTDVMVPVTPAYVSRFGIPDSTLILRTRAAEFAYAPPVGFTAFSADVAGAIPEILAAVGFSAGISTVDAGSASGASAVAFAEGSATAAAVSEVSTASVGTSAGVSTAAAISSAIADSVGSSFGTSAATAVGAFTATIAAVGSTTGVSTAAAIGSSGLIAMFGSDGFGWDFTESGTLYSDTARTTLATLGGSVMGVTDVSGNGRHLSSSSTTITRQDGYVDFPGSVRGLTSAGAQTGSATGHTTVVGFRVDTVAIAHSIVGAHYSDVGVSQSLHVDTTTTYSLSFNTGGSTFKLAISAVGEIAAGRDYVYSMYRSTTEHATRKNGVQNVLTTFASTTPNSASLGRIVVGSDYLGTTDYNQRMMDGRVYAAAFFNRVLTTLELETVEAWVVSKIPPYGLAIGTSIATAVGTTV